MSLLNSPLRFTPERVANLLRWASQQHVESEAWLADIAETLQLACISDEIVSQEPGHKRNRRYSNFALEIANELDEPTNTIRIPPEPQKE